MADRQLRRLKRRELLQMLLAQCEETERLQQELEETQRELTDLQDGYERLKVKLNVKDERLNQKDTSIARLKDQIEEIQAARQIDLEEAGSIAEAALRLNGVFEAAQKAAEQYLVNIKRVSYGKPLDLKEESALPDTAEDEEIPLERRAVSGGEPVDNRWNQAAWGRKIPYESGWKPVARRKKLHG